MKNLCWPTRMLVVFLLILALVIQTPAIILANTDEIWNFIQQSITTEDIKEDIYLLAHEAMDGRGLGTPGEDYTAHFLARELRKNHFKPLGDKTDAGRTFFQKFHILGRRNQVLAQTKNVVGYLEGEIKDEFVIIGAHYDHLGIDKGKIYCGADDNGSGVCAVLEIVEAYGSLTKNSSQGSVIRRSIIIAFWAAEEEGRIGSRHFVDNLPAEVTLEKIKLVVNLDMVGRNSLKEVYVETPGTGDEKSLVDCYGDLNANLKEANQYVGLNLYYIKDHEASDHTSFASLRPIHKIPILCLWTGYHDDYHKTSDTWEKIVYEKIRDIARLVFMVSWLIGQK